MDPRSRTLTVSRGPCGLYVEVTPGPGVPAVLMHGFPDSTHLHDRLLPYLAGRRPVVRFDFLGWGRSDKPEGYAYTAANQVGDLAAVVGAVDEQLGAGPLMLVAHDASGPPAIDWALANAGRVATLVLLNTYYHWTPALRRPPAALYSTPGVRAVLRALVRWRPDLDRRLYAWQIGGFIQDPEVRQPLVVQLYDGFLPARPAFWRLNDDLLGLVERTTHKRALYMPDPERPGLDLDLVAELPQLPVDEVALRCCGSRARGRRPPGPGS